MSERKKIATLAIYKNNPSKRGNLVKTLNFTF
ncbi:hypothetical protein RO3G_12106 [Rhizopus delemar RA 99-880]|uniref:Uncharacterized protein n=1 Tax=Rhizopus delemar (strain RA 99-880 / ATCC MYA-4621 / FGSC 9543 / NRRL 43880) TaxID=246409 RepID=I1CG15_RHIO9|nr:hypothetical protein RO3G_12106 [Rhizopus delemar RA 99-880]|eukprot:EIE87395.1 hypothetical protein RO3G_12106 [Rhizopus delemar RA 99-880]